MIGNNEFAFNEATMKEIVQHYFDTVLFAPGKAPKVATVSSSKSNYQELFSVYVIEQPSNVVTGYEGIA